MTETPKVLGEDERLAVLSALDAAGSAPTERFHRIARMATRYLAVPIVLVSVIDEERQTFKAAIGMSDADVPREQSICARTLANEGVFVVSDLQADPRFAGYPVVTGHPHARSYAGHPLVVAGRRVGTLCVMDTVPRRFDEAEVAALIDLSAWAESELLGEQSRQVVQELHRLQRRTEMVLDGVAEGVIGVDRSGLVTFVNRAAEHLLGWPGQELVGQELHRVAHSRHADGRPYPRQECPVSDTLRTGRQHRLLREVFWRRDGGPLPADWSAGAVVEDGRVVGAVVVFEDATRRVEVDRIKDEFVSVVSHELRTPLTSLRGALDLLSAGLLGDGAGPEAEKLVAMARGNAGRLARLVDDILDLERSSRGALTLTYDRMDVAALAQAAVSTIRGAAEANGVTVLQHCSPGELWGDEHRLLQVLTNLLGNAIRFSSPGGIVQLEAHSGESDVLLSVSDDGVGIPLNVQDRVFERFWQADASDTRARSGTGLGLAIAKSIVEAHGGRITLRSTPGSGSTFTVSLPRRRPSSHGDGAAAAENQPDADLYQRAATIEVSR